MTWDQNQFWHKLASESPKQWWKFQVFHRQPHLPLPGDWLAYNAHCPSANYVATTGFYSNVLQARGSIRLHAVRPASKNSSQNTCAFMNLSNKEWYIWIETLLAQENSCDHNSSYVDKNLAHITKSGNRVIAPQQLWASFDQTILWSMHTFCLPFLSHSQTYPSISKTSSTIW